VTLLQKNRDRLDSPTEALFEHETLDEDAAYAAYAAAGIGHPDAPPAEAFASAARSRDD
jgi:hypothetical protein